MQITADDLTRHVTIPSDRKDTRLLPDITVGNLTHHVTIPSIWKGYQSVMTDIKSS